MSGAICFKTVFFSCPLDHRYLRVCVRYVERNPVRVIDGINHAWEYPWSCARYHMGLEINDPLLGNRKHKAKYSEFLPEILDWKSFLSTPEDGLAILREKTRTGRPCGNESFMNKVEEMTGRILRPQKPGPKKKK